MQFGDCDVDGFGVGVEFVVLVFVVLVGLFWVGLVVWGIIYGVSFGGY